MSCLILGEVYHDNIGYWPRTLRLFVNLFIITFLLVISYYFALHPEFSQLRKSKLKETKLKLLLIQRQKVKPQYAVHEGQLKKWQIKKEYLKLNPLRLSASISFLIGLAKANRLELLFLQPLSIRKSSFYWVLPIHMVTTGYFQSVSRFVDSLTHNKHFIILTSFTLEKLIHEANKYPWVKPHGIR